VLFHAKFQFEQCLLSPLLPMLTNRQKLQIYWHFELRIVSKVCESPGIRCCTVADRTLWLHGTAFWNRKWYCCAVSCRHCEDVADVHAGSGLSHSRVPRWRPHSSNVAVWVVVLLPAGCSDSALQTGVSLASAEWLATYGSTSWLLSPSS